MSKQPEDPREPTRAALARSILRLLALVAVALLLLVAFERPLGLSLEGVRASHAIAAGILGLAAIVVDFYFGRRR